MRIHGLEPRQGDTSFAFFVMRFARTVPRTEISSLIGYVAPICPGAENLLDELAEHGEVFRILALPWRPAEAGGGFEVQRRLIEGIAAHDVDEMWFFQTGTELPAPHADLDEFDEGTNETRIDAQAVPANDAQSEDGTHPIQLFPRSLSESGTHPIALSDADDEVVPTWTHGLPPVVISSRFPVDSYPEILEDHDWEDFGLALKLAGAALPGEETVLLAAHALWLTPYGGRYRNAGVTVDRAHHSAHLWVDRFAVPVDVDLQVHHLLWVASTLDEVLGVVHARFAGATMAQKYAETLDDTDEKAFVLGGNPLVDVHSRGGEEGVDAWLSRQTVWSNAEVAQMLRELAIDVVTGGRTEGEVLPQVQVPRDITQYAGAVLAVRAKAAMLDPRATERLRPLLRLRDRFEHRRTTVIEVLHAAGDKASVPALIEVLRENPINSLLESIARTELLVAAAEALGSFADPTAIPALEDLLAAPERHGDGPRPAAAHALASCLAATPEPRSLSEPVFQAILATLEEEADPALHDELYFALGRLARLVPAERRSEVCARLVTGENAVSRDGLGYATALALAAGGAEVEALKPKLSHALSGGVRLALRVAAEFPHLVDAAEAAWIAEYPATGERDQALALLARVRDDQDAN